MLHFTGERYIPGAGGPDIHHDHVHRYRFASQLAAGRRILDLGCGEGYGSALLADAGGAVVGLDADEEAVGHAREHHGALGVEFVVAPATAVPFPDAAFDLIVCFELVEHLADPGALLGEAARLLTPGGLLVLSTPDREVYNRARYEPNPYHCSELDRAELTALLERRFAFRLFGQRPLAVSEIWPVEDGTGGGALDVAPAPGTVEPVFWIAVAGRPGTELPRLHGSVFADEAVQDHTRHEVERAELLRQLDRARIQLDEYERNIQAMAAALRAADQRAGG